MRLGLIVRNNRKGLGSQTFEMYRHLMPDKVLEISADEDKEAFSIPNSYKIDDLGDTTTMESFLKGLNVVLSCETFYSNHLVKSARSRKIKLVLQPNYEWFRDPKDFPAYDADLYIIPSIWNFFKFPNPKLFLPAPIDRNKFPFQVREEVNSVFYEVNPDYYDRDGVEIVKEAIPKTNIEYTFIIKSQKPLFDTNDDRIHYDTKEYRDYSKVKKGDVYLYPRRYGGQSLKLNEAMSMGMIPIMIDNFPVNSFLPKEMRCREIKSYPVELYQNILCSEADTDDLAFKIDNLAFQNTSWYSKLMGSIVDEWSWDNLLPSYKTVIHELTKSRGNSKLKKLWTWQH